MSNQLVITSGAKVRNLDGVLTGTSGVVSSVGFGTANGVATLDGSGKVPLSQLPASVITYLGTWNASTNTPTLTNGVGDTGDLYICNVAGTVNFGAGPITFAVGDWVIYSGTTWEKSGGASGTVTSVAMTVPTGLSVTGSPITTSGTLAVDLAAGYTIPTTSFLSGLVPYTGATQDVNLGTYGLLGDYVGFNTTPSSVPTTQGTLSWNADKESLDLILNGTTGSVMQDSFYNVKNQTGSTIPKGTVVRANGTVGASGRILIAPFLADGTYNSKYCMGVTAEAIADGADGKVLAFGALRKIDTSAYANGTILYASPSTAGAFTTTEPSNPNNIVTLAIVVYSDSTNGEIFVRPTFVPSQAELIASLGYTPANAATYVPYTGATSSLYMGSSNLVSAKSFITSGTSGNGYLKLSNALVAATPEADGVKLSSVGSVDLVISSNTYNSTLVTSGNTANRTYTFPNASGTIALTSDIPTSSTYVDLTSAQTITGIKTFTNEQLFGNGITLTGGYITYTSGSFNLTLNTNILTANRNIYLPDASGTVALTSNLADFVTTNTMQTITGLKTFSNDQTFNGNIIGTTAYLSGNLVVDSTVLYVDTTANKVGIGNNAPQTLLDVSGTGTADGAIRVRSTSTNTPTVILGTYADASAYGYVGTVGSIPFYINTNNTTKVAVTSAGNVGIGTTTFPYSSTGRGYLSINGSTDSLIEFQIGASSSAYLYSSSTAFEVNANGSRWLQFNTNGSERMRITSSGNVGIGTSSPANIRLRVNQSIADDWIAAFVSTGTNPYGVYVDTSANSSTGFSFATYTNTATGFFIKNNSYVGIGTSTPQTFLDVSNSGTSNNAYITTRNTGVNGYRSGAIFTNSATGGLSWYLVSTNNGDGDWGGGKFAISTNNGVGVYLNGASATSWTGQSDIRLKDIDSEIENALDKVNQLRGVRFTWKSDETKKMQIGVIAQEVKQVLPEAVDFDDNNEDYKMGVQYTDLIPLLINAVKELSAKVSALENK